MTPSTAWIPILLLAPFIASLAWIGWRYFYAPSNHSPFPQANPPWAIPAPRSGLRGHLQRTSTGIMRFVTSRRITWLMIPVLIMGFTITTTLALSHDYMLDPLSSQGIGPQCEVGIRLGEERLVPPPGLPPTLFMGTERANLETADRDWQHLDPDFTQAVLVLFAKMQQRGYPMALLEGFRSAERQEMLADKGPSVTSARGDQSKHQYGMAVDLAPMRDGKLVISERDPWAAAAYQALGEEAAALGFVWGGRWTIRDLGHVESPRKLNRLRETAISS